MQKYLTYKDEKSNKFWKITVTGNSFTITYGKTGTKGISQVKSFESEEKCLKEAEKLLNDKLNKGYNESVDDFKLIESNENSIHDWNLSINTKNRNQKLFNHFSFLTESTDDQILLKKIIKLVKHVFIDVNESLILEFENSKLEATIPRNFESYKNWPDSFKKIIIHHEFIGFGDLNEVVARDLILGDHGSFRYKQNEGNEKLKNALSPMLSESDFLVYDFTKINKSNQPHILSVSHEDCKISGTFDLDIGSLFLQKLAEYLEVESRNEEDFSDLNLDDEWILLFKESLNSRKNKQLDKLQYLSTVGFPKIKSLFPLRYCPNIQNLTLVDIRLNNLDGLDNLTFLSSLTFRRVELLDSSKLKALENVNNLFLDAVNLTQNDIPNTENISIKKTLIDDFSFLLKMPKLRSATLSKSEVPEMIINELQKKKILVHLVP